MTRMKMAARERTERKGRDATPWRPKGERDAARTASAPYHGDDVAEVGRDATPSRPLQKGA